uniref:AlNc14C9G1209 protein n=1 Tax=Albugo laibachii Nc14 TaxID=890382 RepID=F0W2F8_9STRA|nr:AlNc14C9G1209 [Albugo laibachii Nc14]|eukprot:CCA15244.1 AlNc14C9G1209 [Albugo laibachii Nc14]
MLRSLGMALSLFSLNAMATQPLDTGTKYMHGSQNTIEANTIQHVDLLLPRALRHHDTQNTKLHGISSIHHSGSTIDSAGKTINKILHTTSDSPLDRQSCPKNTRKMLSHK